MPRKTKAILPEHFLNRELSWLEFNQRVLDQVEAVVVVGGAGTAGWYGYTTYNAKDLEARLGHVFKNRALLKKALTHASASAEANSPIVWKRSAGDFERARDVASSTARGTCRRVLKCGIGSVSRFAMIAWAVGPV